jgi:hypothetical protein
MRVEEELVDLEKGGWRVLSTSGQAAEIFYRHVLDESPVMLLPGGLTLADRATIVQSMSGQPWTFYEMGELRVLRPTDDIGVVAYDVVANRADVTYEALVSSHYVRRNGSWKLFFHQQTPR